MNWINKLLRRPSRATLQARNAELIEQRDAFEEQVYDLRWHLERAINRAAALERKLHECDACTHCPRND